MLLFDTHGFARVGEHVVYLSDGQIKGLNPQQDVVKTRWSVRISAEEIAEAIQHREGEVVFAISTCLGQNIGRRIFDHLQKINPRHKVKFKLLSGEFGQYGWTDWEHPLGAKFNGYLLGEEPDPPELPTYGRYIRLAPELKDTRPSLFISVPDGKGGQRLMQIVEAEPDRELIRASVG